MSEPSVILIVDDEEDDRYLLQIALRRAGVTKPIQGLPDGADAIEYLAGAGPYANRDTFPLPELVITDFTMPRKSALDLLRWMRQRPQFANLPVIVFVGSGYDAEIQMALAAGATLAFSKPIEISRLIALLQSACQRLLKVE